MNPRSLCMLLLCAGVALAQDGGTKTAPKAAPAAKKPALLAEIVVSLKSAEDPAPAMPFEKSSRDYYGFLKAVRQAAHDPAVDGVLLKIRDCNVGWARLLEVRKALSSLRANGKKVFCYLQSYSLRDLVLASVADRIAMPEAGTVYLPGIASESWYMKDLLDKLHIHFDVIHIGAYKSAGESFVRNTMSKEEKEQLDPILDEIYDSIVAAIAQGRGIGEKAVRSAIDQGILSASAAKKDGLIDQIAYYDQFKNEVKSLFGGREMEIRRNYPTGTSSSQLDTENPMAVFSMLMKAFMGEKKSEPAGPKIAIVYCTGMIVDGKSQYGWDGQVTAMGSDTIVAAIDKAAANADVKAIVLRVNSPGGSGLASDIIWRAVTRAKAKKPVIASMGDVAASGGYYISMNATAILAEPQTITGSIGVVSMVPNIGGLLDWVGIHPQRLTRGAHAAGLLTSKGLSPDEISMLHDYMESFYGDFVGKAAKGRGMKKKDLLPIAGGRVWTGRKAVVLGLVDRIGGLEDAIALAREKAGIPAGKKIAVVESPHAAGPFELFQKMFGANLGLSGIDAATLERVPQLREALDRIAALTLASKNGVCCVVPELSGFLSGGD